VRPAEVLAALGLVSGFLSAGWGQAFALEELKPVAIVFFLDPAMMPIGFFFGAAVGIGVAAWARKPWAALVLLVTTMYAWSAAIHSAVRLQRNSGDDPYLVAASLCAGAVGAGLTHLGCSLFASELRRPWRIVLTCAVGAVAGMLFYLGERKVLDERLLYLIWQPAVAFCIGLGLPRQSSNA
jgi:fumarate reductase subunit D